jgi:mono/diheme cytochrome c family protein
LGVSQFVALIGIKALAPPKSQMNTEDPVMWRTMTLAALSAALAGGGAAVAQELGDPTVGRRLAEAWCMECHAIGPKTVKGTRPGPDFVAVANRPSTTPLSLNVFLRSNHDNMPNFILTRGQADDIVAYILTLTER